MCTFLFSQAQFKRLNFTEREKNIFQQNVCVPSYSIRLNLGKSSLNNFELAYVACVEIKKKVLALQYVLS